MEIMLQLGRESAHEIQNDQPPSANTLQLLDMAENLQVALKATHPNIADPELATFFSVEVSDPATADLVRRRLGECRCVDAAYIKPTDELA